MGWTRTRPANAMINAETVAMLSRAALRAYDCGGVGVQSPRVALAQDVGKPGNPPAWGAGERRFKSGHPDFQKDGSQAQIVERPVVNRKDAGASPVRAACSGQGKGSSGPSAA